MNLKATFTTKMCEILMHRLDVPEAIVDAFAEEHDETTVLATIDALRDQIERTCGIDVENSPIVRVVLADCVEGSTWLAGAAAEHRHGGSHQKLAADHRAFEQLAAIIADLVGRKLDLPRD